MVFTLPRPGADEPASAWQDVVQGGLDKLATLDPRDPIEATSAILVIGASAGALDAYRMAFEPGTTAVQALRQRASAATLTRGMIGAMRLLARLRVRPAVPARDWSAEAAEQAAAWRQGMAQAAPKGAEAVEAEAVGAEPATIVRGLDEACDDEGPDGELGGEFERRRRPAACAPVSPVERELRLLCQARPDELSQHGEA